MSALIGYLNAVKRAVQAQNGNDLGALLRVDEPDNAQAAFEASRSLGGGSLDEMVGRYLKEPWRSIVSAVVDSAALVRAQRPLEAFDALSGITERLSTAFKEDESGWLKKPLVAFSRNIQIVAELADAHLVKQGRRADRLDPKACEILQSLAHERLHRSAGKKDAQLAINNQRLRIYFRINNLNQVKHLIQSSEDMMQEVLARAPQSEAVAFRFFCGRLAVLQENYPKAVSDLSYALRKCHRSARDQQRCILGFLIPARLLMTPSEVPSDRLLTSFGLEEYGPIAEAVRTGSIARFNSCIDQNLETFIQRGVYFLIEHLKVFVYRRLFRRVVVAYAASAPSETESTRVPLQLFQAALKAEGEEMDLDEVECILANLIYRSLIKGYLSHQHRKMVLMKGTRDQQFPLKETKSLRLV